MRYFVLFVDGRLEYYGKTKKAHKEKPKGVIELTKQVLFDLELLASSAHAQGELAQVRLVRPAEDKSVPRHLWALELVAASRTYVLCCRSKSELDVWSFLFQSFCS